MLLLIFIGSFSTIFQSISLQIVVAYYCDLIYLKHLPAIEELYTYTCNTGEKRCYSIDIVAYANIPLKLSLCRDKNPCINICVAI